MYSEVPLASFALPALWRIVPLNTILCSAQAVLVKQVSTNSWLPPSWSKERVLQAAGGQKCSSRLERRRARNRAECKVLTCDLNAQSLIVCPTDLSPGNTCICQALTCLSIFWSLAKGCAWREGRGMKGNGATGMDMFVGRVALPQTSGLLSL